MSLILTFRGSSSEPREYESSNPVECVICRWDGDADEHAGDYDVLRGVPEAYWYAKSEDVICHDCSLYCVCGEDVLDRGVFVGAYGDAEHLYCLHCTSEALCPEEA